MYNWTITYRLLGFGRKYKLGWIYRKYALAVLRYLKRKQYQFSDDLLFDGGSFYYLGAAYLLTYGRFEFYYFVVTNVVGAVVAEFFPFLITDFVYDAFFFFFENPLLTLIIAPLLSAGMLSFIPSHQKQMFKLFSLWASLACFAFSVLLLGFFDLSSEEFQFQFQANFTGFSQGYFSINLGLDGLSVLLVVLTNFLFALCFWYHLIETKADYIKEQAILIFLLQFSVLVAFIATDLILFYIFFEASLIPMFLFIGIWGAREQKILAAYKMFFYTLLSSMPALLGFLLLNSIVDTSSFMYLLDRGFHPLVQNLIWFLLFLAFATKLPMVPLHLWLPEAHVEATTTGSVILAGLLLKLGGYGFFRFLVGLFPNGCAFFAPGVILLSLFAIVAGSLIALRQIDMKKAIAYSSIAHMGFVSMGFVLLDDFSSLGANFILFSHGLISAGLFFCVGFLYARYKTKTIFYFNSLATVMPVFSLLFCLILLGNVGLPTTSGFVGEFLIFVSLTRSNLLLSFCAVLGVALVVSYSFWLFNRVCFGQLSTKYITFYQDLSEHEFFLLLSLILPIYFFGILPQCLLEYYDFYVQFLNFIFFLMQAGSV